MSPELEDFAELERFVLVAERLLPLLERLTTAFEKMAVDLHILTGVRSGGRLP